MDYLQLIMSAGGVAIATDQEQQLALVLMWPYSEYHMMQNAARCRDMEQYLSVWKPHTANTSPHDIPSCFRPFCAIPTSLLFL